MIDKIFAPYVVTESQQPIGIYKGKTWQALTFRCSGAQESWQTDRAKRIVEMLGDDDYIVKVTANVPAGCVRYGFPSNIIDIIQARR